jgi:hypothetical protein
MGGKIQKCDLIVNGECVLDGASYSISVLPSQKESLLLHSANEGTGYELSSLVIWQGQTHKMPLSGRMARPNSSCVGSKTC